MIILHKAGAVRVEQATNYRQPVINPCFMEVDLHEQQSGSHPAKRHEALACQN